MKSNYKIRLHNQGLKYYVTLLEERKWFIFWYWAEVTTHQATKMIVYHTAAKWQEIYKCELEDKIKD